MPSLFRQERLALPPVLWAFSSLSVAFIAIAFAVNAICRNVLHLTQYPYGLYLLPRDGDYIDLRMFRMRFAHFHSTQFFSPEFGAQYLYPAAVAPFYKLYFLFGHDVAVFLLAFVALVVFLGASLARILHGHGVAWNSAVLFVTTSILSSYALYFEFNRANMEVFVWLFSAVGVLAFLRRCPWIAAACIGIAGAMKLFPFIYLGLLISRRMYRQAASAFLAGALFSLASLWAICPDLAVSAAGIYKGLHAFGAIYVVHLRVVENGVDHSFFGLMKHFLGNISGQRYQSLLSIYMPTAAILGSAAYFFRIRHLPVINQVLCLATASILLPPTSYDYTLLHLYTPWALLVVYAVDTYRRQLRTVSGLWPVFACFLVLLGQIGEIIVHGERIGGQLKAVALIVLFVLGLCFPFEWPELGDNTSAGRDVLAVS